jgi:hypothetical protein
MTIQAKAVNIIGDFEYFPHEVNLIFMAGAEINKSFTK